MKNLACIVLACTMILTLSTPAFCQKDTYIEAFIGASVPVDSDFTVSIGNMSDTDEVEWDPGYTAGIAMGFDTGNTRFEAELAVLRNEGDDSDDGYLMIYSVLFNFYYDFITKGLFTPYLTAGVGLGSAEIGDGDADETDGISLWQVGAGFNYEIRSDLFFDVRYRYLGTSEMEFEDGPVNADLDFSGHNVIVGIVKYF